MTFLKATKTLILVALSTVSVVASAQNETPQEQEAKETTSEWRSCVRAEYARFAASKEPAETVVTAMFSKCVVLEDGVRSAWFPLYVGANRGMSAQAQFDAANRDADEAMVRMRTRLHDELLAALIEARLPKG